jgi:DNA-binding NtrC family response regulator
MEERPAVVVVDNHPEVREVLSGVLEALSFRTYSAGGYGEALHQLAQPGVCALVTDVEMHPETGFDLLATCRQEFPDIPVILVSSYASSDLRAKALRGGAAEFLAKPFTMEALHDALERCTRPVGV